MTMENKLPKNHNPANWQWMDREGRIFKLNELSREDLMQVACNCMQALEDAESLTADLQSLFESWRTGGPAGLPKENNN